MEFPLYIALIQYGPTTNGHLHIARTDICKAVLFKLWISRTNNFFITITRTTPIFAKSRP